MKKYILIRLWGGGCYDSIEAFNTHKEAEDQKTHEILKNYKTVKEYKEALENRCGKDMYEYHIDEIEIEMTQDILDDINEIEGRLKDIQEHRDNIGVAITDLKGKLEEK